MVSAILHSSLRSNGISRACISEERNHGKKPDKNLENVKLLDNIKPIKDKMVISDSQPSKQHKLPPLVHALKASATQNFASFHFPGHNMGKASPSSLSNLIGQQPFLHDISELPMGPILDAQRQAAELFGATETWFLVGGTTCGVHVSVMATCSPGDTLILPRNSHISAFSSMVLSGAIPKYITPEYDSLWDISCGGEGKKPSAVLITSPTYHGICANLQQISSLCHSQNTPLIIDEAHGAHFAFHDSFPLSALQQGADLAVQSTHKVLPSLTQSSMLHMSGNLINREKICQCLQTLQTTSPSYLLLSSLDAARAQISENPKTAFNKAIEIATEAKYLIKKIPGIGILNSSMDPLRITVGVWELGISGFEADDILYEKYGVASALVGTRSITFLINLGTRRDDVLRLVSGLKYLSESELESRIPIERTNDIQVFMGMCNGILKLSPREAFFASKKKMSFRESIGEICGELVCPFPPGIPLLVPGEVITEEVLRYLVQVKSNGGFISGAADSSLSTIVVCS